MHYNYFVRAIYSLSFYIATCQVVNFCFIVFRVLAKLSTGGVAPPCICMASTTISALEFNLHHQTHNFNVLLGHLDCYNIHRRRRQLLPRLSISDDACSPNKVSWPLTNVCFSVLQLATHASVIDHTHY